MPRHSLSSHAAFVQTRSHLEHQKFRAPVDVWQTSKLLKMIVRGLTRAQAPKIVSRRAFCLPIRSVKTTRRHSSSHAPSMASATPQSQASMLATISTDLDKIAPKFEVQPDQITIIQSPAEFYATLKVCFCQL